jgi:hypothetical protein
MVKRRRGKEPVVTESPAHPSRSPAAKERHTTEQPPVTSGNGPSKRFWYKSERPAHPKRSPAAKQERQSLYKLVDRPSETVALQTGEPSKRRHRESQQEPGCKTETR